MFMYKKNSEQSILVSNIKVNKNKQLLINKLRLRTEMIPCDWNIPSISNTNNNQSRQKEQINISMIYTNGGKKLKNLNCKKPTTKIVEYF